MNSYHESENTELKEKFNESFVREVVAFLNTEGGRIYIGINDKGQVSGVGSVDDTLKKISDCITDQIEPSPRNEIRNEVIFDNNLPVVVVSVCKGIRPLYCIRKYGFSSKGCLSRIGTSCKEMTSEEIQFRYRQQFTIGDYMLETPSRFAPLSFDMMKILLTGKGLHINETSFDSSFRLKASDGSYNLLAEIMADRNMVPMIFVKFTGKDKTSISQRNDYGSQSLILGYQKLKDRLIAENICKTDTTVRPRRDRYLYDMDCVNEALVNMLVHNDWTITEPLVSFYSDRLVFTSHGGLPQGLSRDDFFNGISHPRNSALMRIFLNLGIVEHTGHGIPMIVRKYGRGAFDIHDSYIDVTIPFDREVLASMPKTDTDYSTGLNLYNGCFKSENPLSKDENEIIIQLIRNPKATYDSLAEQTGLSRRTVARLISSLAKKGFLERVGNNKSGFWKIIR